MESDQSNNMTIKRQKYGFDEHIDLSVAPVLGSSTQTDVLNLMVEKLFRNLQRRVRNEAVVKRTLHIFNQSVTGVSVVHAPERLPYFVVSGRLLLQSPMIKDAILDHQNIRFTFLSIPQYANLEIL